MFTDEQRVNLWEQFRQLNLRKFAHLLSKDVIGKAAENAGVPLGRGALNLATLTWLAVSSALHGARNFAEVLVMVLKLLDDAGQLPRLPNRRGRSGRSKHDPHGDGRKLSEEAFVQARNKMPTGFWVSLILLLGKAFEEQHAKLTQFCGMRLLALDGTTINLAGYRELRNHFGTASNGRGPGVAQARLVMMQLPLVRVPLAYELAPIATGERTVAGRLLEQVRARDLVLMDKGFWSYGLFCQIQKREAFFAIRLMRGTGLKSLKQLGYKDRLVSWSPSDRQWKTKEFPKSITLRVIDYQVRGFRPSAIVTNHLDNKELTRQQWIGIGSSEVSGGRLGEGLYHQRWQIETSFGELKVRQGMEGSLRGRTPQCIAYEVAGHILLYLLTRWLMVEAAVASQKSCLHLSFTKAQRELQDMAPLLTTATPERARRVLLPRLLERVASHEVPHRPGRHYPRPGDTKTRNKGKGKRRLPSKLAHGKA